MVERVTDSRGFRVQTLTGEEARARHFHLGVWFCGYEARSSWLRTSSCCPGNVDQWFRIEVEEGRELFHSARNRQIDESPLLGGRPGRAGWDIYWRNVWRAHITGAYLAADGRIDIMVDISSMPRSIYAPLLVEASDSCRGMVSSVVLAYVPGEYRGEHIGNQQLDGLRSLCGIEGIPRFDGGTAVVLGLGYDGVLADTAVDLLQFEHFSAIYADPGISESAAERCRTANAFTLSRAELVEIASVGDLASWICGIHRLVGWYDGSMNVLLLPMGPKPQVVACILYALQYGHVGFRYLLSNKTTPLDVDAIRGREPYWMSVSVLG